MEASRRSRVSEPQLEMLWEFLIANTDIAKAYNRSTQAKAYAQQKWREIADILNAQGEGAHKDGVGWSKYWVDYKAKLKKRVAAVRAGLTRTGGGPSTEKPLTDIENKFLQILGADFGQGSSGVRVEPFPEPPQIGADVQDSPESQSILRNIPAGLFIGDSISTPPQVNINSPRSLEHPPQSPDLVTVRPSQRRRLRRRRGTLMSQETARRAISRSVEMHAEAAVRIADAAESISESLINLQNIAERFFRAAYPGAVP